MFLKKIFSSIMANKMLYFLIVSTILGTSSVEYYIQTQNTNAASWPSGYNFAKTISLNGSAGAGNNYQVLLKVGESSGSLGADFHLENHSEDFPSSTNDGGDLYFTDNDGLSPLDFWVETVDGLSPNRTASVWVKVSDNLDLNTDIICYYGNASAINQSSESNTFIRVIDNGGSVVATYHFEDAPRSTLMDSSGNNNHGSLENSPTWGTGKFGSALSFDGVDDEVSIPDSASLNMTDEITVAAWIKWEIDPTTGNPWAAILNKNVDNQYRLQHNNGNTAFEFAVRTDTGGRWAISTTAPTQGDWYFVVGTYDGSQVKIYVNGVLENFDTHSGSILTSTSPISIGSRTIPDRFFNGSIDNLFITDKALSLAEISDIYENYAFSTPNNPGKLLVRKYVSPDISFSLAGIERSANEAPNKPINLSPSDLSTNIDTTPTLSSSDYLDNESDPHLASEWQVDDDSDFSSPVWTRTSISSETTTLINDTNGIFANELSGENSLSFNTDYFFRVRYSDGSNSDWSDYTTFKTAENPEDPWLSGYKYRKTISISGQPGAGIDYQVLLKVAESDSASSYDYSLEGQSELFPTTTNDGGDLRFLDNDNETPLSFWVEKVEGVSPSRVAFVWLKVADNLDTTVEVFNYYGNASATNQSSDTNTFIRVFDTSDTPLKASFKLDEASGTESFDSSGNANNATLHNNTAWVSGKFDFALSFDGISDYVSVADSPSLTLNEKGSLSAWIKLDDYQNYGGIIHKGHLASFADDSYFLQMGGPASGLGNNKKVLAGGHNGVDNVFLISNTELNLDTWYHIFYTWDTNGQHLYINGILDNSSLTVLNARTTSGTLQIGSQLPTDYRFKGQIDDLLIMNRYTDSTEVTDLYNNYAYSTVSYPSKLLIKKRIDTEPSFLSASTEYDGLPVAPSAGIGNANSVGSIRWNFLDNSDNEIGFKLYDEADLLRSTLNTNKHTSIDENGLSENTKYSERYVKAFNSRGESISSGDFPPVYTLTGSPSNLIANATSNSITLSVDSFPNDSVDLSGYYFERIGASNSGWIQTNSWTDSGLNCGTTYNYSVKYRNGDAIESVASSQSFITSTCSSGGAVNSGGGVVMLPIIQSQEKRAKEKLEKEKAEAENELLHSASEEIPFIDMEFHWAVQFVNSIYKNGYIKGYGDKTFKPDQPITRAELSKIIAMWFSSEIPEDYCNNNKFKDVSCDDWFSKFVEYLSEKGVIHGYSDGNFLPNNTITRAEAIKIMVYAKNLFTDYTGSGETAFSDVLEKDWFYSVIVVGKKKGIANGYPDGTFKPNSPITRAEASKLFVKLFLE